MKEFFHRHKQRPVCKPSIAACVLVLPFLSIASGCSRSPVPEEYSLENSAPDCYAENTSSQNECHTEERLHEPSASNKEAAIAEDILIRYFTAAPEERTKMKKEIQKAASYIKAAGKQCPGHLIYAVKTAEKEQGLSEYVGIGYADTLGKAISSYFVSLSNPGKDLSLCRDYRIGKTNAFVPLMHIEVGMISRDRADLLLRLAEKAGPLDRWDGKTIADIGGGAGLLCAAIAKQMHAEHAAPQNLICVDIEPSMQSLIKALKNSSPYFCGIEYRFIKPDRSKCGLKTEEADLACLFDVHNIYDRFSTESEEARLASGAAYLQDIRNSLKPDGVLLIYDAERLMTSGKTVKFMAEQAGFEAELEEGPDVNQFPQENPRYLVICRKKHSAETDKS